MRDEDFHRLSSRCCLFTNKGFSLVELLIVLLLLGVGTLMVLPAIDRGLEEREVKQAALGLAATARNLRGMAVYEGSPQRLILNPVENSYGAQGGRKVYLSAHIKLSEIIGGEPGEGEERKFVFFPNGSVLGQMVAVAGDATAVSYRVRLDALSGRVVLEAFDRS
jgi:general secretion pathway protein H